MYYTTNIFCGMASGLSCLRDGSLRQNVTGLTDGRIMVIISNNSIHILVINLTQSHQQIDIVVSMWTPCENAIQVHRNMNAIQLCTTIENSAYGTTSCLHLPGRASTKKFTVPYRYIFNYMTGFFQYKLHDCD